MRRREINDLIIDVTKVKDNFTSIIDLLQQRALKQPNDVPYMYLKDGETIERTLTYKELDRKARKVASYLQSRAGRGERAVLLYPPGLEFITAFFGCLYTGVIAIPAYHNLSLRRISRFQSILDDSGAKFCLTTPSIMTRIKSLEGSELSLKGLDWVITTDIENDPGKEFKKPEISKKTTAYLQYTSGSTSTPKGVIINHENILHNLDLIYKYLGYHQGSLGVSWLPHYHDMGLVGTILLSLFGNVPFMLMAPIDFLQKPLRWLQVISDYKVTASGGPNFAYDLCVQKITPEQRNNLDLSSWECAWNGAEPIRAETIKQFYETFKGCGFRYKTHYPCYGLAEATLAVSFGNNSRDPVIKQYDQEEFEKNKVILFSNSSKRVITLVGSGREVDEIKIAIVDPGSFRQNPPDSVGEVWASSHSNAQGYWNRKQETNQIFGAYLADTGEGPFMRTGDLGFIENGELYVTGRLKDMIIIRGVNYYPNDIELTVEQAHPSLCPNSGAAFAVESNGEERLVIIQEVKRTCIRSLDVDEVVEAIRGAVLENHEIQVYAILFIKQGSIPKTSSGKIQRQLCKKLFQNNEFNELHKVIIDPGSFQPLELDITRDDLLKLPPQQRENILKRNLRERLGVLLRLEPSRVSTSRGLIPQGMDSLSLSVLKQTIEEQFKVRLEVPLFFETRFNLEKLTRLILSNLEESHEEHWPGIVPQPSQQNEPFPLTDLQYAYWIGRNQHFELGGIAAHVYFEVDIADKEVDFLRLQAAWNKLIKRHDMLRAVVTPDGEQKILEETPPYEIEYLDLQDQTPASANETMEMIRQRLSHQVLPADQWPLFEICFTRLPGNRSCLHLSFDLLIADIWSLNILMREWYMLYRKLDIKLPPLGVSFRDYVLTLRLIRETPQYERSRSYWQKRLAALPPAPQLTLIKAPKSIEKVQFTHRGINLDSKTWNQLKTKASHWGITPSNLLMAAFSKILSSWSKSARFTLNLTLFNRLELHPHINQLVGDFTSVTLLEVDDTQDLSFIEFARSLQKQLAMDLEHRYYNGVEVIRDIEKARDDSFGSLTPVVFTSALSRQEEFTFGSKDSFLGTRGYVVSQTPQVWLDHQVYEEANQLVLSWDAVEELFPGKMLDQMFDTYISFLKQLAVEETTWETRLRSLIPNCQLTQREQYNSTEAPFHEELLHTRFIKQAQENPDFPAVFTIEKTISYGELLRASIEIAYFLRDAHVKPNELVAILMTKGWEQIAAVMGILQAGGAYLPIDPELPPERKKYLMDNGGIRLVLTREKDRENIDIIPEGISNFSIGEALLTGNDKKPPLSPIQSPGDLAYIVYTSGSTGFPKGVMISHQAALNTIIDINRKFEVTEQDRVFAISCLHFDLSVYDIFGMLSAGAAVVLPKPHTERNPDHWLELMEKYHVTIWNSVPALMELLVENVEAQNKTFQLRLALLSGDWIPVTLPERIWALAENMKVVSLGGATEASVWSIYYPIDFIDTSWASIPYGIPLANQTFYVLNEKLGHCPDWVSGELYIGGVGVAEGYRGDKEKTERAFITHPDTGRRLYRTGDLGRFLPGGYIEFLGREDFQVKLGGYRVEIGEIESTLNQHPKVRRAAVKKTAGKDGNEFLTAFLVLNTAGKLELDTAGKMNKVSDYEMEIKADEGTELILEPMKRLAFKLEQPGIRQLDGPSIPLKQEEVDIRSCYLNRASSRRFLDQVISFEQFSKFLDCLRQVEYEGLPKFRYASAGGLYPVQVYIHVKPDRIEGVPVGSYYYNPCTNSLIRLKKDAELDPNNHFAGNRNIYNTCSFSIFLIGQLDAITPMYGAKARDFSLVEAGLITQLLENSGVKNELGVCQIGGLCNEIFLEKIFQLNDRQIFLHALVGGKVAYHDPFRTAPVEPEAAKETPDTILSEIKSYCFDHLPKYMVPLRWTFLEDIPLTNIGKINYKALEHVDKNLARKAKASVKPRSELEKMIASIIKQRLSIEEPDIYTSFFELGADSLTIVKVWRALMKEIGKEFPVVKIFENPTINDLALFLGGMKEETVDYNIIENQAKIQKNAMRSRFAAVRNKNRDRAAVS
jgi:amino acid adenylation domain-containing protein